VYNSKDGIRENRGEYEVGIRDRRGKNKRGYKGVCMGEKIREREWKGSENVRKT